MNEPLFSIITITKNNVGGLKLTGKSILQQFDAPQFEWLIIDGGSTDRTTDLIREWNTDFIRFVSQVDRNKPNAMNRGLAHASGRYVWFLPAGDCLSDMYVMRDLARELRTYIRTDLLYGDARDNGIIHKAKDFTSLMRRPIIPFQAMLFRRAMIEDLRFDENLTHGSDYAFTLQFQERAHHIHYAPRLLCDIDTWRHSHEHKHILLHEHHTIRSALLRLPAWKNLVLLYWDKLALYCILKHPKMTRWYLARKSSKKR